ncbi:MAG: type II secretion system F family protein [Planctomycetaceae bacterium]|nr:type II secretion system F family protein [Planctomycetales bacterium]MCB9927659.1 type II secretion system F family protein [Planctomycetaceae bacterium]
MFDTTLAAVGPLALIALGLMLLWAASYRSDTYIYAKSTDLVAALLRVLGWTMLLVGLFIMLAFMSHVFAIFLWIATIVVLISGVVRYFAAEQQSLLWALTVAAEHGIPLESAARSFSEERNDRIGARAALLADYLEAGVPLSLALKRSRTSVPSSIALAADLGQESGDLGLALRNAVVQIDDSEMTLRWTLERLFYVAFVVLFSGAAMSFLMVKIVPVFKRMFAEFEMELPYATEMLIAVSDILSSGWPLLLPLVAIWLLIVIVGLFWYMGVAPQNLPLVNRFWWSADCALVLRWLATAVRHRRPLADSIRTLALRFPHYRVRVRLERASSRIDRGADWCESLRAAGIIRRPESTLFKTAERVGNLDWTLEEMANSGVRRAAYRIRVWISVLFPVALLTLGALVLFITVGILMPLIAMIQGLA